MPHGLRAKCCIVADNMAQIETWRAGLSEGERAAQNHPEVVVRSWRRATRPKELQRLHVVVNGGKPHKNAKPISWRQDALRRAATAIRENPSRDLFIIATVALNAA